MRCEVCGRPSSSLKRVLVEGAELLVCPACRKYGIPLRHKPAVNKAILRPKHQKKVRSKSSEDFLVLVPNYASLIRKARERMGLSQEDFAKKLNEKLSLIKKIEQGRMEPTIPLARKIEKFLSIRLVTSLSEPESSYVSKGREVTLGDIIGKKIV